MNANPNLLRRSRGFTFLRPGLASAWLVAVLVSFACPAGAAQVPPDWLWAKTIPGTPTCSGERPIAAAVRGPEIFVAAGFSGVASLGTNNLVAQGNSDMFLARLDLNGQPLWVRHAIGKGYTYVRWVSIDLDSATNIYVAGRFAGELDLGGITVTNGFPNEDAFLAKYDPAGNLLWAWQGGQPGWNYCAAVAVAADDTVVISGHLQGCITFDKRGAALCGDGDAFVARFTSSGSVIWYQNIGGYDDGLWRWQEANGLAVDAKGNIYVTGAVSHDAAFGTLLQPPQTNIVSGGTSDIFVAKYDASGRLAWVRQAGNRNDGADEDLPTDYGRSLAVDPAGNVFVTGAYVGDLYYVGPAQFGTTNLTGGGGFFLAKYNTTGDLQWVRETTNAVALRGTRVRLGAGSVFVSRDCQPSSGPNQPLHLLQKYDLAGNLVWSQSAAANSYPSAMDLAVFADESILVVGDFWRSLRLGGLSLTNNDTCDLFFARLASNVPRLDVAASAGRLTLSWPSSALGFCVEASDSLAGTQWQPVSESTATNGLYQSITVAPPTGTRFYRLRQLPP